MDWEVYIKEIAGLILGEQTPAWCGLRYN